MSLTPSDFYYEYGTPVTKRHELGVGERLQIPADENRYLLVFFYTNQSLVILPAADPLSSVPSANFVGGSQPVIFTHALHGALVNMPFILSNELGIQTAEAYVIYGRMKKSTIGTRRKRNATNK